jgi:hypothetical protein
MYFAQRTYVDFFFLSLSQQQQQQQYNYTNFLPINFIGETLHDHFFPIFRRCCCVMLMIKKIALSISTRSIKDFNSIGFKKSVKITENETPSPGLF